MKNRTQKPERLTNTFEMCLPQEKLPSFNCGGKAREEWEPQIHIQSSDKFDLSDSDVVNMVRIKLYSIGCKASG